jgi:hypothetical protein
MPSIASFQSRLYEIADELEEAASAWMLEKPARDELAALSDRAGALRATRPERPPTCVR